MEIYEDGSDRLDIDAARRELKATEFLSNEPMRKAQQSVIQIAALLDVAGSLRTLALESALAMRGLDMYGPNEPDEKDDEREYLQIDDLVRYVDKIGVVETLDMDGDGEAVADVNFGEGVGVLRLYVSDLERPGSEEESAPLNLGEIREASAEVPLIGVATPDETPSLREDGDDDGEDAVGGYELDEGFADRVEAAEEIDAEDLVDDIDADFAGESHPEAESAVDVLRRNEEKHKAAKKAAPKKGKKS